MALARPNQNYRPSERPVGRRTGEGACPYVVCATAKYFSWTQASEREDARPFVSDLLTFSSDFQSEGDETTCHAA